MVGYSGYSKSNNAIEAESEGRYPLSRATKELAKLARITQDKARGVLLELGSSEYHHTSKIYNLTAYYCVKRARGYLRGKELMELWPIGWKEDMARVRMVGIEDIINIYDMAIAAELGCGVNELRCCYYKTWEDMYHEDV